MDPAFKTLLDTKDLWLPGVSTLLAQASATRPGNKIEHAIKNALGRLKEPQSEKAFSEAFESGVENYSTERGNMPAARSAARILARSVSDPTSRLDAATVIEQLMAEHVDDALISSVVSGEAVVLEDALTPSEAITNETKTLICDYLRPAFRAHPHFSAQVASSEIRNLLKDIREAVSAPPIDLVRLRADYCSKLGEKYDVIPMQGISPKVQNRTVGIRMEDIFIPLKARQESESFSTPSSFSSFFTGDPLQTLSITGAELESTVTSAPTSLLKVSGLGPTSTEWLIFTDLLSFALPHVAASPTKVVSNFDTNLRWAAANIEQFWGTTHKPADIKTLLHSDRIVVRGDPGSGKSTFMRYIAWALSRNRSELIGQELAGRIPILVRAIEFGEALEQGKAYSLEEYLAEQNGRFAPVIKQALACGNALILIDGLDEVSKLPLRARVKERVDDFVADPAFSQNRIVITSRIVGYERSGLTGNFKHFTISELDDDQIRRFIVSWYAAFQSEIPGGTSYQLESEQLIEAISGNDSIRRMARNPLLLTIIALIKWQGRALPDQRVLLYDAATQTLIRSWPLTQRRVEFDELFIREWLAPVALHILSDRTGDLIDDYSLMTELADVMRRLRSMTELQAKTASRELLDSISEHSGFLLPRGTDADGHTLYGFFHQTFAEFLAAYHLVGRWEDGELKLLQYAHDPYWREVFLLMAGHLGTQRRARAGKFIEAVRYLRSSPYEDSVHRDLLLACQILADGTPAGPSQLIESLLSELLSKWKNTRIPALQQDIEKIFRRLRGTEYAEVLARLATEQRLSHVEIAMLAGHLGSGALAGLLERALRGTDPEESLAAMELLFDSHRAQAVETALRFVSSADARYVRRALASLIKIDDPSAIAAVIDRMKNRPLEFQWPEIFGGAIGHQMADAIAEYLTADDPVISVSVAILLTQFGDRRGEETLRRLALATDEAVTRCMTMGVAVFHKLRTELLIELLRTPDKLLRSLISSILTQRALPDGAGDMIELRESDRGSAGNYIPEILAAQKDPRGVAILRERLKEGDKELRLQAARALARIGATDGIETLTRYLDDPDPRVRLIAIRGLQRQSKALLLTHLNSLIQSENVGVRLEAIGILANFKDAGAISILVPLLDDTRFGVRSAAASALASKNEQAAVKAMESHLKGFMESGDGAPRDNEAEALANCGYEFLKRHLTPTGEIRSSPR